ncbi:MAG: hypothetical protein ACFE0Q_05645 [Anaerolineae bacterium]
MSDEREYPMGLTGAEWENLLQAIKYGAIIVITVLITFTVVAGFTRLINYDPPSPSVSETSAPYSPEN